MEENPRRRKGEMLVVQSKVKDLARRKNFRVGSDFIDALSEEVENIVRTAMDRAQTNGRSTLRAGDL